MKQILALPRTIWVWLFVFALLGVAGAFVGTSLSAPKYTSTATVFVSTSDIGDQLQSLAATVYVQTRMASYSELATSDVVLQRTIGDLGLRTTPEQLADSVTAVPRVGALLIDVHATAPSASRARALAESIATNLRDVIDTTVEDSSVKGANLVHIQLIDAARTPSAPTYPNNVALLVAGGALGIVAWFGIALIASQLAVRLRNAGDVFEVTDAPILASIALVQSSFRMAVSVQSQPDGHVAEGIRQLRTNLAYTNSDGRAIVITSSVPREGKTTTAINLALAMALAGERVLLIDADLRRPKVAEQLNIAGKTGLTNLLRGISRFENVVQTWGVGVSLAVLPSGATPPNPSELLGSNAMRSLLEDALASYDRVIIDAPPVLPATDGAVLGALTGATIVVAGMGRISPDQLRQTLTRLSSGNAHVLGIVLNLVAAAPNRLDPERAERTDQLTEVRS